MTHSAICYADSRHGIYIPQFFAESINVEQWKHLDLEDMEILKSGPEHESYWDAWDFILNNAETVDGRVLWQDGDLWIIDADSARDEINAYCESQLEYAESHKDAGDGYSHMPAESWTTSDDKSLLAYLVAQDIQTHGMGIDDISRLVLEDFKMYRGSIYGPYDLDESAFILAAYPVQEIEIDLNGIGLDAITLEYVRESCDAYIKGDLAYMTSDAVWFAAITKESLQSAINAATINV